MYYVLLLSILLGSYAAEVSIEHNAALMQEIEESLKVQLPPEEKKKGFIKPLDKFLSEMKKLYEKRDVGRAKQNQEIRECLYPKGGAAADYRKVAELLCKFLAVPVADIGNKDNLMINLHQVHAAQRLLKDLQKPQGGVVSEKMHHVFDHNKFPFQTDTVVKAMTWGALVTVFLAAAYQVIFTVKKFV